MPTLRVTPVASRGGKDAGVAATPEQRESAKSRAGFGDPLDDWGLTEVTIVDRESPQISAAFRPIRPLLVGKRVVIIGIAGAYAANGDACVSDCVRFSSDLRASGVDEVWCVVIQNPYVLGVWGLDAFAEGRVRLFSDRDGRWARALGFVCEAESVEGQVRALPYALLVEDAVVKHSYCADSARDAHFWGLAAQLCNGYLQEIFDLKAAARHG